MPAIAWPPNRIEIAWGVLAVFCLAAMIAWPSWETIPFHVIWITLTLLYGFRVWSPAVTGMSVWLPSAYRTVIAVVTGPLCDADTR